MFFRSALCSADAGKCVPPQWPTIPTTRFWPHAVKNAEVGEGLLCKNMVKQWDPYNTS
jgi:hypothetical protein